MSTTAITTTSEHHPTAWYAEMNSSGRRTYWACTSAWMLDGTAEVSLLRNR